MKIHRHDDNKLYNPSTEKSVATIDLSTSAQHEAQPHPCSKDQVRRLPHIEYRLEGLLVLKQLLMENFCPAMIINNYLFSKHRAGILRSIIHNTVGLKPEQYHDPLSQ